MIQIQCLDQTWKRGAEGQMVLLSSVPVVREIPSTAPSQIAIASPNGTIFLLTISDNGIIQPVVAPPVDAGQPNEG